MTATKSELAKAIETLANSEIAIETNEGTYGAVEAMRAIRTGDPKFADYTTYERVGDGTRRTVGCDPARAPGRARRLGADDMRAQRERLAELRRLLKSAK